MSSGFVELDRREACPCDSGRTYGRCCAQKEFTFGHNSEGELIKQIKMAPEVVEIVRAQHAQYQAYYGRPPGDDDLVFAFASNPAESINSAARELLKGDLSPDIVYAFCRSDGLLPVEGRLDVISDTDLAEFSCLRDEYDELSAPPEDGDDPSAVWFVANGNQFITQFLDEAMTGMRHVLSDFLARHSQQGSFVDFQIKTPLDYANFSAHKTFKTIHTIERLREHSMTEAIYAMARGLLENYLYLNTISHDLNFFTEKVLPKADRENFTFAVKNGRINYNQVIHQTTGAVSSVWVTNQSLLRHASDTDRELFDLFYQTACQFVHVDVLSARAYFHEADPFDELDPASLAALVVAVLSGQLISALSTMPGADTRLPGDIAHFLGSLAEPISVALQLADSDPEHQNEVWAVLRNVVGTWS